MVKALIVYVKFGDHYMIPQIAKLKLQPDILVIRYNMSICR